MNRSRFETWWRRMRSAPRDRQNENFHRWLNFACKTVAHRGEQNQQRLVYTVFNRYDRSEYRRLSKRDARRVYMIINNKTDDLPRPAKRPEVEIVRKRTVKTISSGGKGRQKD